MYVVILEGLSEELTFWHKFEGSKTVSNPVSRETASQSEEAGSTKTLPGTCTVCLRNIKETRKSSSGQECANRSLNFSFRVVQFPTLKERTRHIEIQTFMHIANLDLIVFFKKLISVLLCKNEILLRNISIFRSHLLPP